MKNGKETKRFTKVYSQGALSGIQIWEDSQTGVQYMLVYDGYVGGMTVLLDADGKPLINRKQDGE